IIVILVNLIGGLLVGTMKHGLAVGEAFETYALLSVGDGLVAQIPSLFVSVASGTLVTRVASELSHDLGTEVAGQLFDEPRALTLGAVILVGMAFIPGFPTPAFLLLAAVLGVGGFLVGRRKAREAAAAGGDAAVRRVEGSSAQPSQPKIGSTA